MIYVICGPTGSGKTSTANKLADIKNAPIVNADAFQVYQEMNIGTAKINKDDPHYKNHYLLDIIPPNETFSVMEYQKIFRETIDNLSKQYQDIIVCGGTGLYIRASLYDYVFDEQVKDDTSDLEKLSNEELYQMLIKLDEDATKTIHINNRKRVIRAISIARTNKQNKSSAINAQKHELIYPNVRILMLNPPREELYQNINARVDKMFQDGLVDEVKYLLNKYDLSLTAKAAIGYKEVIDYLNGQISLSDCVELIKKRTRNYAKRQVTFFKNQFHLEMFASQEELLEAIKDE